MLRMAAADALIKRLLVRGMHGGETIARHASENFDHLPLAVIECLHALVDLLHRRRNPESRNAAPLRRALRYRARTQ